MLCEYCIYKLTSLLILDSIPLDVRFSNGPKQPRGSSNCQLSWEYRRAHQAALYAQVYGTKVVPSLPLSVYLIAFITDTGRLRL